MNKSIDLAAIFQNHAQTLVGEARVSKAIHNAGNIAQSGQKLEAKFRELVSNHISSEFRVHDGFFYDPEQNVSGQIDMMISETRELFMFNPDPKNVQGYAPFTSVSAVCQIKNSISQLSGSFNQIKAARDNWLAMKNRVKLPTKEIRLQRAPVFSIVIGTSDALDEDKLSEAIKNSDGGMPDLLLILDKGWIVAGLNEFIVSDHIAYQEIYSQDRYFLCAPGGASDHALGKSLLWFLFAHFSRILHDNTISIVDLTDRERELVESLKPSDLRFNTFLEWANYAFPLHRGRALT